MEQETLFDLGPDWTGFDKDARTILGKGQASEDQPAVDFPVAGRVPERVVFPRSIAQVSQLVQAIEKHGLCAVPVGMGAHTAQGGPPDRPFVALSLSGLDRIVDFQPSNMTLRVECGATLDAVQACAEGSGQWLPLDPPLAAQTTIGGLIAANLTGPARFSQGTVRDLLIGLKIVTANGSVVKGGGQVVKNVAGYDLPKLFCGSEGTLGIIVEATFKLRPRPEDLRILRIQCGTAHRAQEVLTHVLGSGLEPSFLELVSFIPPGELGYNVVVGCFGPTAEVSYQAAEIGAMLGGREPVQELAGEEATSALGELRDFRVTGQSLLRLEASLLPTKVVPFVRRLENEGKKYGVRMALQAHAGNGITHAKVQSVPAQTDTARVLAGLIARLRGFVGEFGGTLALVDAPADLRKQIDVWGATVPGAALMRKLKQTLDPKTIFSPGRFLDQHHNEGA